MEDTIYKITLTDGTELNGLRLNGDNFISDTPIAPELIDCNCSPVIIFDGESSEVHENMELVQITRMGSEYWFVLRDIPEDELEKIKMQADIEYIAMMSNIEL